MRRALLAATVFALAGVSAAAAYAAFSALTSNAGNRYAAGTVTLTDNDGGSAMLSLSNAVPGASDTSCIRASYSGSLESTVRHYGTVSGALAPYLRLKVTRGSGSSGFDNCTGFSPDTTNYVGAGAGVIYDGDLSDYPASYAAGLVDPNDTGSGIYTSTVQGTPGLLSYWRLGDNSSGATATVVSEAFTDTAGVLLQNHSPGTWTRHGSSDADAAITDVNRVRRNGTGAALYYASGVPLFSDYSVQAEIHVKSISLDGAAVIGRADTATNTYYRAGYFGPSPGPRWELYKVVNGTSTMLGSYAETITTGGSPYTVKLDMQGSTIRLLVNGTERIAVTDTAITAAGRGGLRLGYLGATSVPNNSSGLHIDNLTVTAPVADDSKGTNDGAYFGGVTLGQTGAPAGDSNTAAQFSGAPGRVEVPNNASLQLTGSFSIEAWVKLNTVSGQQWILNKDTVYYLYLIGSDVVFGFWSGGLYRYVIASGAASSGSWQHFVGTYDGSMVRLYKNGVEVASSAQSGALPASAGSLFIGAISAAGPFIAGTLDEVALYNSALSAATVSAHYAAAQSSEIWINPESHDYKFEITMDNDLAVEGLSATATFSWEARNT